MFTIYAIIGDHAVVCQAGQVDPVTDYVHKGDDSCCWESLAVLADCELVSDAPATSEPGRVCSGCRAEVCICDVLTHHAAPPAQESAKAEPRCEKCPTAGINVTRYIYDRRELMLCSPCQDDLGAWANAQGKWTDVINDLPARLPRPRLAHSMGVEDPCLEDA